MRFLLFDYIFSLVVIICIGAWWCDISDMILAREPICYQVNKSIAAIGVIVITFPYTVIIYVISYKMKRKK